MAEIKLILFITCVYIYLNRYKINSLLKFHIYIIFQQIIYYNIIILYNNIITLINRNSKF